MDMELINNKMEFILVFLEFNYMIVGGWGENKKNGDGMKFFKNH